MFERPITYPLLRARRPRGRGLRRTLRLALIALASAALVAAIVAVARRAAAPDPAAETRAARAALAAGDYSAARRHAARAIGVDPSRAEAQVIRARADLALGDGIAAEGALNRAIAAGADRAPLRPLLAEAWLRQGDADRALRAASGDGADARRVRARALAAKGDVPGADATLRALLDRTPGDAGAWTDLGRLRLTAGDVGGADAAAQRAVALAPAEPAALTLRGEIVRSRYGLAAALPWFRAALAADPAYPPALTEYAATLGDLGRYRAMLAVTRRALQARPGDPQALYLQAVLAARAGRVDLARSLMGRTGGAIDAVPGVVLLDGALAYAAGDYEAAVARWRELVGRQPMNLVARRLLGAALLRSGDPRGALDVLRPIALREDADSYTLTLVARAFEATGERDWAARFLDRAARPPLMRPAPFAGDAGVAVLADQVENAPGDPTAVVPLVRGLLADRARDAALARAQQLAAAAPGAPAAHLLLGDTLAIGGSFAPALAAYGRAASLRFDPPTLLRLVEAATRAGRPRDAAAALALFLAQNPQSIPARRMLANLQLAVRDWPAALATLAPLRTALGDRDALLLAQIATARTGAGDPRGALDDARRAFRLAPMSAITAHAYGWALHQAGDRRAALPLLTRAATLAPDQPEIRAHLAQARAGA